MADSAEWRPGFLLCPLTDSKETTRRMHKGPLWATIAKGCPERPRRAFIQQAYYAVVVTNRKGLSRVVAYGLIILTFVNCRRYRRLSSLASEGASKEHSCTVSRPII